MWKKLLLTVLFFIGFSIIQSCNSTKKLSKISYSVDSKYVLNKSYGKNQDTILIKDLNTFLVNNYNIDSIPNNKWMIYANPQENHSYIKSKVATIYIDSITNIVISIINYINVDTNYYDFRIRKDKKILIHKK